MKQTLSSISRCLFSSVALQDKKTFHEIVAHRKKQASHSILVELPTGGSSHLYDIYSSYGQVKKIIGWKNLAGKNFLLVEFNEMHPVKALLRKCSYQGTCDGLPTFSRLLYYRSVIAKSYENSISLKKLGYQDSKKDAEFLGNSFISEQMTAFYQREKLKDIHIRLRFLMCTLLEDALKGIFPNSRFIPVGSTVNGLGSLRSDLNLVLAINTKQAMESSSFYHSTKKALSLYKNGDSCVLCTVGDILQTFLPCVSDMKKNMLTTPSVIRFQHHILGVSCSLTVNDLLSTFMSELLFLCGELDLRVKLLILTVKQWACDAKITQNYGGPSITSFTLTLMVIFFLQSHIHPVLPPFDEIQHQGVANNFKRKNVESIDSLLKGFFHFLSTFNFKNKCISVNSVEAFTKPDFSPLYIRNPMDQEQNLCKNVTRQKLYDLIETAGRTLWILENISHNSVMKNDLLGLLSDVEQASVLKC